jgi:hypothetical protein
MTIEVAVFDPFRKYSDDGTVNLSADVINVALLTSAFNPAPTAADWVAANSYAAGTIIKPAGAGGRFYEALSTGVSSGATPIFPVTRGDQLTENTMTWKCWGFSPPSEAAKFADVSAGEIAGTGYTAGGAALTNKAMTYTKRTARFSADPARWPGALFAARYAVIYKVGTANGVVNPLIAYLLLDSANADVTINPMSTFSLEWNAAGIFTFS